MVVTKICFEREIAPYPQGAPMNLGPTELLIVLAIVLLLFGSAKLPKLARSLGQASKEFKQGTEGTDAAPAGETAA